jgi:hypothetical protein
VNWSTAIAWLKKAFQVIGHFNFDVIRIENIQQNVLYYIREKQFNMERVFNFRPLHF